MSFDFDKAKEGVGHMAEVVGDKIKEGTEAVGEKAGEMKNAVGEKIGDMTHHGDK